MTDSVAILVVGDDQLIQGVIEEALTDGGFGAFIAASGEEAMTLLKDGNSKYRAVVTDVARRDGWLGGREASERDRPGISHHLHDRRERGSMAANGASKKLADCEVPDVFTFPDRVKMAESFLI